MSHVILFHSAYGLRPAVLAHADDLRAAGHTAFTPDLFDGAVFDDLDEGVRKRDALGIPELIRRAHAAVASLPADAFYAGFSMGAAPAQLLAATRPGARGLFVVGGVLPPAALELDAWPDVPVQVHYAAGDPFVDAEAVAAMRAQARAEVFTYPCRGHLFDDPGLPEHDVASAASLRERLRAFVA